MSDLITDAMVEAATVASTNASLAPWGVAITTTDHLQGGVEALAEMRAALEAVAPLIAAKVWDEALQARARWMQDQRYYVEDEVPNPYYADADAIERGES